MNKVHSATSERTKTYVGRSIKETFIRQTAAEVRTFNIQAVEDFC